MYYINVPKRTAKNKNSPAAGVVSKNKPAAKGQAKQNASEKGYHKMATMVIDFGKKYKGKTIDKCDDKYLRWLVSHTKVLALRNRWASRDATFELERRSQVAAEAAMAVKVAEEIIKESTMLNPIRKTDYYGFCWQESMIQTILANKDSVFTASEMYSSLESVSQGEEFESLKRVEMTLEKMTYAPGPIRLEKVGEESYKFRFADKNLVGMV